ncbi:1-phosphatidylinositol 3-phosphate 5-kinase FAB1 [Phytophthora nicotianae]|uniref:1-phosphatidylinositol 3-phosphate 5-kinase FAB1 n=1 Tax=Phytophthora nicotianae TaxID=4792 RepID=A0A0W8D6G6_PHYNI|nr:1-phosphatidylinositol 3-phosphate 5-kinase FAB1 [Phytophthora nicotianae]
MPPTSETEKHSGDPHYYKRGMLTLEMQFLPSEQPKIASSISPEVYELMIHRIRGDLQDSSTTQHSSGLAKHVFIDVSIMIDRGGSVEELAVGATDVISLSPSGLTEVGVAVDLSNPMVAATLSTGVNNILVGRIRDLAGNTYGRVHFPLRKDWKERLVNRKKQIWYPVCVESNSSGVNATKNAVLMSLKTREQSDQSPQSNTQGKVHVKICEAMLTSGFENSNLLTYGGANVQLSYTSKNDSTSEIRSRTRQSTVQSSSQHWCWENEWFVFDHSNEFQELHFSLHIGISSHVDLHGRIVLTSMIEDATLRRLDLWLPLENEDKTASAYLHAVVVYIPTIIGTLIMDFSESSTFTDSERILHVEKTFYKCIFHDTSRSTATKIEEHPEDEMGGGSYNRLRFPLDTRLTTIAEVPELVIHHIGVTKMLGEICLGVAYLDLLSVSDVCCLISGASREGFTWCTFKDQKDRTKTTGVAKLRIGFDFTRNVAETQPAKTVKTLEKRVHLRRCLRYGRSYFIYWTKTATATSTAKNSRTYSWIILMVQVSSIM